MYPYVLSHDCLTIVELALKNQALIARSLDFGLLGHARELRRLDDKLLRALRQGEHLTEEEQRAQGFTHYIWHTTGDDKVRPAHAANDGKIFSWDDPPSTGHPGEDYGCRCWAQPFDGIEPVYPLETIIGGLGTRAGHAILREILRRIGRSENVEDDINNAPEVLTTENTETTVDKIANGHAYDKHSHEFPEIRTREDFKKHIEDVINNPDAVKPLERGRTAYWDNETGTVVIESPNDPDGGTAFRPENGKSYFDILK